MSTKQKLRPVTSTPHQKASDVMNAHLDDDHVCVEGECALFIPKSQIKSASTPKVKPALAATGRGLHRTGSAIADVNLRSLGKGVKALGRKIPIRIDRSTEA